MENNSKKMAIYARVSSDKQDVDLSISAQLDVQKGAIPVDFFGVIFVSVIG